MTPRQPKTGRATINHGGMSLVDVRLPGANQYLQLFRSMQDNVRFFPIISCRPLICMLVVKSRVNLRMGINIRIVVFNFMHSCINDAVLHRICSVNCLGFLF